MRLWKVLVLATVGTMVIAGGANLVAQAGDAPPPGAVDVKGPCDEAEHAGDPECLGPQVPEDDDEGVDRHRRGHDDGGDGGDRNDGDDGDDGDRNDGDDGDRNHDGDDGDGDDDDGGHSDEGSGGHSGSGGED